MWVTFYFLTGFMVGFEWVQEEESLVIDLGIVRIILERK